MLEEAGGLSLPLPPGPSHRQASALPEAATGASDTLGMAPLTDPQTAASHRPRQGARAQVVEYRQQMGSPRCASRSRSGTALQPCEPIVVLISDSIVRAVPTKGLP